MLGFTIRRLMLAVPTVFAVVTIIFLVMQVLPGDPAIVILGNNASEEALESLRQRLGLNQPLWAQYFDYVSGLVRGDLGNSIVNNRPIAPQLLNALPFTASLATGGVLVGVVLGLPLGIISALKRNTLLDFFCRILALGGISFPAFYLGILLIMLFALRLNWFPVISGERLGLRYLALPILSLGFIQAATIARMTRSSVLEVLGKDYVQTARAKGLSSSLVILKHVLRNSLIPIVTIIGLNIGLLLGGAILTETVFNIAGIGKLLVGAIHQRDYPLIQGGLLIFSVIVVVVNLIVDLTYGIIDPKVQYD
ncbi:MAG: ABC transporter permease [Candidatus Bipolaricaulota bacterium]